MVNGIPDWQLDRMLETESERMWAENNDNLYDVIYPMSDAWNSMSDAQDKLASAADKAEGTRFEGKILSILDAVEALQDEIKSLKVDLEKEVHLRK